MFKIRCIAFNDPTDFSCLWDFVQGQLCLSCIYLHRFKSKTYKYISNIIKNVVRQHVLNILKNIKF